MAEELSEEIKELISVVFFSYMKTILFRTARDYIEAEKRRKKRYVLMEQALFSDEEAYTELEAFVTYTKDNYHIHLQNQLLSDSIPGLRKKDRDVLFMLYFDRLTTIEAAEILGKSQQAVSKQQRKLLKRLADELQHI